MVSCYFFYSPRLAIGAGLSKYDNGTYTKHLHKTKRHDSTFDGRNSIVITCHDLILYVTSTILQLCRVLLGKTISKLELMCLAQGHNAVAPARLEPTDTRSRVKHSTTTVNLNLSILKISYYTKCKKKKSSCYFFAITFLSSILAKCVNDKAVEETFHQLLQKVWCLLHIQILCTVKPQKFELRFFEILANSK